MSSLFDKFRTLVKANIPGRRSPAAGDEYVTGADMEARLDWMEQQERKKPEEAMADPEAELQEIIDELEAEQAVVDQPPVVDEAALSKAQALIGSAESEITIPADASEAVKKSAREAQTLIDKTRKIIGDGVALPEKPADAILEKASKTLDSASEAIGVPTGASEVVKKSAAQANELIEKARDLINEKSPELSSTDEQAHPPEPIVRDSEAPSSDIDDIKRRLG